VGGGSGVAMFTKKSEKDAPAASGAHAPSPELTRGAPAKSDRSRRTGASASLISQDLVITGNLTSEGEIEIDGEVQGDVRAKRIIVGERAQITGALIADEVIVRGGVQGQIRALSVTFQATSRVEGDIFHKSLLIEEGALFEGRSRRSETPMVLPRSGDVPPPA
jgi:cytoskeletal protein CcmA (bactofilin family)